MYSRPFYFAFGIALLSTLAGCDATSTATDTEFVVQSYLTAEEPLPPVRVFHSIPADETYDPESVAVTGAEVVIRRLEDDGEVRTSYSYNEVSPGTYWPRTRDVLVAPATTYRLEVQPPDGSATIRTTTTVPETIEIEHVENRDVVYQEEAQPSLTFTHSGDGTRQNAYVFTVTSLLDFENTPEEELKDELTPFFADAFDDEDDIEDLQATSTPLINEANFDVNADGTITVKLPWLAIALYGPNRVTINVLDDNLYDLVRTHSAQQDGFSPGEIPNVIEHVEGGAGIFGSYARQQVDVEVLPR